MAPDWKNPILKVKAPKVVLDPLEPISIQDVRALLNTCQRGDLIGERDRALFLFLLDTGARARIDGFETTKFPPFGLEIERNVFQKKPSLPISNKTDMRISLNDVISIHKSCPLADARHFDPYAAAVQHIEPRT